MTKKSKVVSVSLDQIRIDGGTQPRCEINQDAVNDYAENADSLPPMCVMFDGKDYWLWDGFHRYHALRKAGRTHADAEVSSGTQADAVWCSVAANKGQNSLRRTNKDKQRAVEMALQAKPNESDWEISRHVGVSQTTVSAKRRQLSDSLSCTKRVGKDGKTRDTSNIGKKSRKESTAKPQPEPEPTAIADDDPDDFDPDFGKQPATITPPVVEPASPEGAVDAWGIPIQPHAQEAFAAVPRFKELATLLRRASRLFSEIARSPGGEFLQLPAVSSYRRGVKNDDGSYADRFVHKGIEQALQQVVDCTPQHTVCPYEFVDSPHPEKCSCCKELRWTPVLGKSTPSCCKPRARQAFGLPTDE